MERGGREGKMGGKEGEKERREKGRTRKGQGRIGRGEGKEAPNTTKNRNFLKYSTLGAPVPTIPDLGHDVLFPTKLNRDQHMILYTTTHNHTNMTDF